MISDEAASGDAHIETKFIALVPISCVNVVHLLNHDAAST